MRARLAIAYAQQRVQIREIELRNKPEALIIASPKATVPVLVLENGPIIDESIDIMRWALRQHDPEHWLRDDWLQSTEVLIHRNDGEFKHYLDRYKYPDRYPEFSSLYYRQQAEKFLTELEQCLQLNAYLCGEHFSLADAAILPFIRQFAAVDGDWFASAPYAAVRGWLQQFVDSQRFIKVMSKYQAWQPSDTPIIFATE